MLLSSAVIAIAIAIDDILGLDVSLAMGSFGLFRL